MTIQSNTTRVAFTTDGATTVFPVNIQAYQAADFLVTLTAAASAGGGESVLALNSAYTLASSGTETPPQWTLTTIGTLAAGQTLQVILAPAQVQQSQYVAGQAFPSSTVQTNLDRLTQMVLRLQDQINRCVRFPDGDVLPGSSLLPAAGARASQIFTTDANGNVALATTVPAGTVLSASSIGLLVWPQTAAESLAGVTPTYYQYAPGDVRRYGARGDGVTDDTAALNSACKSGANVYIDPSMTVGISSTVTITTTGCRMYGSGTIQALSTFVPVTNFLGPSVILMVEVTGQRVVIDGLTFNGSSIPTAGTTNNCVIGAPSAAASLMVKSCSFLGFVTAGNGSYIIANQTAYVVITGNYATGGPGFSFTQGRGCVVSDNTVVNPANEAIVFNSTSSTGAVCTGNTVYNSNSANNSPMIVFEDGPGDFTCVGNALTGFGAGIACHNVLYNTDVAAGGVIANNKIDMGGALGAGTSVVIQGLYVSQHYANVKVEGNHINNLPTGLASGSSAALISVNGGTFSNNYIDGTGPAIGASVQFVVGDVVANGITVSNNVIRSSGKCVLFAAGNYNSGVVTFEGGKFYGGTDGIDSDTNAPSNFVCYLTNLQDFNVATPLRMTTYLGSRATLFNAGGWQLPHWIHQRTTIWGNAAPTTGTYFVGDEVKNISPTATGTYSWVCTTAGSPGTWTGITIP